jgi:hypothetical protein
MSITDLIPPDKLTDIERKLFERTWDAGWNAHDEYTRAAFSNSSGLRGDGEPLERTPRPVNPYSDGAR